MIWLYINFFRKRFLTLMGMKIRLGFWNLNNIVNTWMIFLRSSLLFAESLQFSKLFFLFELYNSSEVAWVPTFSFRKRKFEKKVLLDEHGDEIDCCVNMIFPEVTKSKVCFFFTSNRFQWSNFWSKFGITVWVTVDPVQIWRSKEVQVLFF